MTRGRRGRYILMLPAFSGGRVSPIVTRMIDARAFFRSLAFALALIAAPAARADGTLDKLLTPDDKARLAALDTVREAAVATAREKGAKADVAVLDALLVAKPLSVRENFNPVGAWRCRAIKLGRSVPITVYGWFRCRISEDGVGFRLEKLGGSQRTAGYFYDDTDTALIYAGALSYAHEPFGRYGQSADRNMVGKVFRTGRNALRIEFPKPVYDSDFDMLELVRE
ncbi:MAG: DUF4893 domain-containing protein [Hyphomicrobiales bacterium]